MGDIKGGKKQNTTKHGGPNELMQQKFYRNYKKKAGRESGTGNIESDNGWTKTLVKKKCIKNI